MCILRCYKVFPPFIKDQLVMVFHHQQHQQPQQHRQRRRRPQQHHPSEIKNNSSNNYKEDHLDPNILLYNHDIIQYDENDNPPYYKNTTNSTGTSSTLPYQYNNQKDDSRNDEDDCDSLLQSETDEDYLGSETLTTISGSYNSLKKIDWDLYHHDATAVGLVLTDPSCASVCIEGNAKEKTKKNNVEVVEQRKKNTNSSTREDAQMNEKKDSSSSMFELSEMQVILEPILFCCCTKSRNDTNDIPIKKALDEERIRRSKHKKTKQRNNLEKNTKPPLVPPNVSSNTTVGSRTSCMSSSNTSKKKIKLRYSETSSKGSRKGLSKGKGSIPQSIHSYRQYNDVGLNPYPDEGGFKDRSGSTKAESGLMVDTLERGTIEIEPTHLLETEKCGDPKQLSPQKQPFYDDPSDFEQVKLIFRTKSDVSDTKEQQRPSIHAHDISFTNYVHTDLRSTSHRRDIPIPCSTSSKSLYTDENDQLHTNDDDYHNSVVDPLAIAEFKERHAPSLSTTKPMISIDTSTTSTTGCGTTVTEECRQGLLQEQDKNRDLFALGGASYDMKHMTHSSKPFITNDAFHGWSPTTNDVYTKKHDTTPQRLQRHPLLIQTTAPSQPHNKQRHLSSIALPHPISIDVSSISRISSHCNGNSGIPTSPSDDIFPNHTPHPTTPPRLHKETSNPTARVNISSPIFQYSQTDIYIPPGTIQFKITDSEFYQSNPYYRNETRGPVVSSLLRKSQQKLRKQTYPILSSTSASSTYYTVPAAIDTVPTDKIGVIRVGDHIIAIDDVDTIHLKSKHVRKLLKKNKGMERKITVLSLVRL